MNVDTDILIAGGGLNGCTLALALAQIGLSVTVVDPQSAQVRANPDFDGRGYALALASTRLLGAIGMWTELREFAQPILQVIASDGRAGEGASPLLLDLNHADIEEGPVGHMLEDRFLRAALITRMAATEGITHLSGLSVTEQSATTASMQVVLSDGQTLRTRLLVGADGRRSGTATRAGIRRSGWGYDQTALVCAVDHALPHNGIAHQFFMPSGPLAILPLPSNRSSIVWSEKTPLAAHLASLDDAAFLAALRPRFGDFLGEITLSGNRFSYPLDLTLATRTTDLRLALVGDAAQGIHPIAGQGLNQGLRDIATLVQVIADASRRGEDVGAVDVLDRFRQWRSFDRMSLAIATDSFNRLFSNDNPLLRLGRDLGMAAISAAPGLRTRVLREAAGLTGDLPKLLQGLPA